MNYRVEKGTIYTENGLPHAPRWFCDGRIAFQADNESITEINYFGPKSSGSFIAFLKRFWKGMTFYTICGCTKTVIRPSKCKILPFGFQSLSEECEYGIFAANDCIYITFRPLFDGDIAIEFYDDFFFYPETRVEKDIRYGGIERRWEKPCFGEQILSMSYTEQGIRTNIAFSSNGQLVFRRTTRNFKNVLFLQELSKGKAYVVAISFSNGETRTWEGYDTVLESQLERYKNVAEKAPVLKSSRPLLNQFFQMAPLYHESLKTVDVPGAIRAQTTHYWVWGWDSMTSNDAVCYWGDSDFVGQMLECMETYSDNQEGIAHAFGRDMKNIDAAAPPAQGMYITLLDLYRLSGGDWQRYYPFAKRLFDMIAATEVRDTGLCRGTSLYPDFRDLIKETGNDISTFNNTVSYCAIRSMEQLAKSANDMETARSAGEFAERMKSCFERLLYNENIGFIDSSMEADTYEKRGVPSNNAIKWENNFCGELIEEHDRDYLLFYEENLVSPSGIRPLPEWNECYDADSNQLHCWWPVMSEFYIRLINRFDKSELINQYAEWVEYWSERLMCPEGISCYGNRKEVPFDSWNCMCGIWHGYSIRGFYNAIIHGYVGIDFDEKGLNIYPYSGEEVAIDKLHFGEKIFDIRVSGRGKTIVDVTVNGESLGSVTTVPFNKFSPHNTVQIIRGPVRA